MFIFIEFEEHNRFILIQRMGTAPTFRDLGQLFRLLREPPSPSSEVEFDPPNARTPERPNFEEQILEEAQRQHAARLEPPGWGSHGYTPASPMSPMSPLFYEGDIEDNSEADSTETEETGDNEIGANVIATSAAGTRAMEDTDMETRADDCIETQDSDSTFIDTSDSTIIISE